MDFFILNQNSKLQLLRILVYTKHIIEFYIKNDWNLLELHDLTYSSVSKLELALNQSETGSLEIVSFVQLCSSGIESEIVKISSLGNIPVKLKTELWETYKNILHRGVYCKCRLEKPTFKSFFEYYITEITPFIDLDLTLDFWKNERKNYSTSEWINLILNSVGFNPENLLFREKIFILMRLLPFVCKNYNLLELGPRALGKSYFYELSDIRYSQHQTRVTVPDMFYNAKDKVFGSITYSQVVGIDEVASNSFDDKNLVENLQGYTEAGRIRLKSQEIISDASLVLMGNIDDGFFKMNKILLENDSPSLFSSIKNKSFTSALLDRFHCFIPSWGMEKISNDKLSSSLGIPVSDFFRLLDDLREFNLPISFQDIIDFNSDKFTIRDSRSVENTVKGLIKLLHPDLNYTIEELNAYCYLALEGRNLLLSELEFMAPSEYSKFDLNYTITLNNETLRSSFGKFSSLKNFICSIEDISPCENEDILLTGHTLEIFNMETSYRKK